MIAGEHYRLYSHRLELCYSCLALGADAVCQYGITDDLLVQRQIGNSSSGSLLQTYCLLQNWVNLKPAMGHQGGISKGQGLLSYPAQDPLPGFHLN